MTDDAPLAERLTSLAEARPDEEVCGFVVEDSRGELRVVEVPNRAGATAREAFLLDPAVHLALSRRLRAEGGRFVAVFHSHVDGPARLSPRDLEGAVDDGAPLLPGVEQIVIGMSCGKRTEIRMFGWDGARFSPRSTQEEFLARRVARGAP